MNPSPEQSVIHALLKTGEKIATAESLTAGSLAATLANVPDSSQVFLGGIVSYSNEIKSELLNVDVEVLETQGAVCGDVAEAMAVGVRQRFNSQIGISTTGVAGPAPHQGKDVGTVFIGISSKRGTFSEEYKFDGSRDQIRRATVAAALSLLAREIRANSTNPEKTM